MDRRGFLKYITGGSLGLLLPVELSATLTIVDIELLDSFTQAIKFKGTRIEGVRAFMDAEIKTADLWPHVRLVDSEGRRWHTDDQGQSWHHGLMAFSLPIGGQDA